LRNSGFIMASPETHHERVTGQSRGATTVFSGLVVQVVKPPERKVIPIDGKSVKRLYDNRSKSSQPYVEVPGQFASTLAWGSEG